MKADFDPALPGERESREEFRRDMDRAEVGNFYADANRAGFTGWDLLIDYDRAQDVPGMVTGSPVWVEDTDEGDMWALEVRSGEPDIDRLRVILEKRLARAGYEIQAFQFGKATNGWHLKVKLNEHPAPVEAVALQAVCGSDPSRESCNVQRAREVERWARDAEQGGSDIGHAAAEFWRIRWNVLYQPNPQRRTKT